MVENTVISRIQRSTFFILILSAVLTAVGGFYAFKLYSNLRTDLEELLPRSSRSVQDLDDVARRLSSIDNLAVLVFSKDTVASKRFVEALVQELSLFPKSEVTQIEYRIDRELQFFRERQALYADQKDLIRIRDYVKDRIQYESEIRNPLNLFSGNEIPEPELDFRVMEKKYENRESAYTRFPGGYFATPDETKRVVLIDVPGKTLGVDGIKRLKKQVDDLIKRIQPKSYAPDMEIHYTGSVEEMLEEQEALVEDLAFSTIVVLVIVTGVIFLFFRSFWATSALIISLLAGTIWTFGASYFAVGYLNANSAFLGSIVLGNGINFGIILLARYLEERRKGIEHLRATRVSMAKTYKATLTAALAAGLSYGSLSLTSFRGFKQFGVIGLIGMTLCWVATYTMLPAMLTLFDRYQRFDRRKKSRFSITSYLGERIAKHPKPIAIVCSILTVVSLLSLTRAGPDLLETNLAHLRSKKSEQNGAAYYTQYLNQIFQRFLTPIVILPTSREHAIQIAAKLKEIKKQQGPSSPLVSVQTIDDFVPANQKEKLVILRQIRDLLPTRVIRHLSSEEKDQISNFLSPRAFATFTVSDLPPLVRDKFSEKGGKIGNLVLVEPPLSQEIWREENLTRFVSELRSVADSIEPGAPVAGGMAITADLVSSISHDGPRATLMSLFAVVVLVVFLFRDPKMIALALFALFVGVAWFGGSIVELGKHGFRINFLNFVALPITFGIGVDYGVNIFQRYREDRIRDISTVICETGGAVWLSSFTTSIGYSSLLMASNQGFISFGLLAVLGEICCVTAALVALPSVLAFWQSKAKA